MQSPRPTALSREQSRLVAEALEAAWADSEIRALWTAVALEVHVALIHPVETWGTAPHVSPISVAIGVEPAAVFDRLITLVQERVPALEHVWGPDLGAWIVGLTVGIVAPEIGPVTPATIARFLPDNPFTMSRDPSGMAILQGVETATVKHFTQISSYFKSLLPPGKPGRPKGLPKPKASGKPSLPPDLALQVHEAKLDGMRVDQIIRHVLRESMPSDAKARNRLRAKIYRLHIRGARLKQKKTSVS